MMSKLRTQIGSVWNAHVKPFLKDPILLNKWNDTVIGGRPDGKRMTAWVNDGYRLTIGRDDYTGDVFMFVQDMHQIIMPSSGRRSNHQYSAVLEPANNILTGKVVKALGGDRYGRDLSDALRKFVERVTQSLFYYGKAVYEVRCDKDEDGNVTDLEFYLVFPPTIRRLFGSYWQVVTWKAAKHAHIKAGLHRIPSERLLVIEFPKQLGGRRGLKKVIKELIYISKEVVPDFQMAAMKNQVNSGFDFSKYIWNRYIEKGKITRRFGWDQRKTSDSDMLEYYTIYRHLQFAKSQATIRKHILGQLNKVLQNQYIKLESEIVMKDILTPEQIDDELRVFKEGDIEFSDLYKRTSGLN